MRRKLLGIDNVCIIVVVMVVLLLPFVINAVQVRESDFYKIVLRWPKSYCNSPGRRCQNPMKEEFVIHTLIPMYSPNQAVDPYNPNSDPKCTRANPAPDYYINETLFGLVILQEMVRYWPNILYHEWMEKYFENWRIQWIERGKCFDHSIHPLYFYETALNFVRTYDLLKLLYAANIEWGDEYDPFIVARALDGALGTQVQIRCSLNTKAQRQELYGVSICHSKQHQIERCPERFSKCDLAKTLWFPWPTDDED